MDVMLHGVAVNETWVDFEPALSEFEHKLTSDAYPQLDSVSELVEGARCWVLFNGRPQIGVFLYRSFENVRVRVGGVSVYIHSRYAANTKEELLDRLKCCPKEMRVN